MSDFIFGKNAVYEYIKKYDDAEKIYIQNKSNFNNLNEIIDIANRKNISIQYTDKKKLDEISKRGNHQGVLLLIKEYKYYKLDDILGEKEDSIIAMLDGIEDPQNLGAIIRTAEAAGASAVIIPKHRAASVNHTVHKTSAGATSHMKVVMVTNINQTIDILKENGYWVYGADGYANTFYDEIDYPKKTVLIIGNEGKGISRLTKEKCDELIKIPMYGKTESLNASNSFAILIYEVIRQKNRK